MFKRVSVLVLIFIFSLCIFAQTEKYSTPIKWEKYKNSEQNFSVLFPKLPVLIEYSFACSEVSTNKYAAYAGGIAYGIDINFETKQKNLDSCSNVEKFSGKNFEARLKEIKVFLGTESEQKFNQNNLEVIKVKGNSFTYWFINDFINKRWFEIWVTSEDETNLSFNNFIESFKIEKNPAGIEIGKGALGTLGDEPAANKTDTDPNDKKATTSDKSITEGLRIILKPIPRYTDSAKDNKIQGVVLLKVVFLANGGIGSITTANALPFGLTEQAISAARKLVFIPAQRNGVKYSVVKTVQYNFLIY